MFNVQTTLQKNFFAAGNTLDIKWRINRLLNFKKVIRKHQEDILEALKSDLNKPKKVLNICGFKLYAY